MKKGTKNRLSKQNRGTRKMVGGMTRGEFFLAVFGVLGAIGAIMKVGPSVGKSIEDLRDSMKINRSVYDCARLLLASDNPKVVTDFLKEIDATPNEHQRFIKLIKDEKSKLRKDEIDKLRLTKYEEKKVILAIGNLNSMTKKSGRQTAEIVGEKILKMGDRAVTRRKSNDSSRTKSETDANNKREEVAKAIILHKFMEADKRGKTV